jgi:hypothetical protein
LGVHPFGSLAGQTVIPSMGVHPFDSVPGGTTAALRTNATHVLLPGVSVTVVSRTAARASLRQHVVRTGRASGFRGSDFNGSGFGWSGGGGTSGSTQEILVEGAPSVRAEAQRRTVGSPSAMTVMLPSGESIQVIAAALNSGGGSVIVSRRGEATILAHRGDGFLQGRDDAVLVLEKSIVRSRHGNIEITNAGAAVESDDKGGIAIVSRQSE